MAFLSVIIHSDARVFAFDITFVLVVGPRANKYAMSLLETH